MAQVVTQIVPSGPDGPAKLGAEAVSISLGRIGDTGQEVVGSGSELHRIGKPNPTQGNIVFLVNASGGEAHPEVEMGVLSRFVAPPVPRPVRQTE